MSLDVACVPKCVSMCGRMHMSYSQCDGYQGQVQVRHRILYREYMMGLTTALM